MMPYRYGCNRSRDVSNRPWKQMLQQHGQRVDQHQAAIDAGGMAYRMVGKHSANKAHGVVKVRQLEEDPGERNAAEHHQDSQHGDGRAKQGVS
jgi:hypothetical protein